MALIDSIMLFNKAYDMARPVEYYLDCNERVIALSDLAKLLDNMPTIEPETEEEAYERGYTAGQMAERKKGKWVERNPQNSDRCRLIECDQCGFSHIVGFNVPYGDWVENRNFCERCGADMKEESGR